MPYASIDDLPKAVRDHLPKAAQKIYLGAFNSAWEEYASPGKRRAGTTREETAHRVAWTAVKAKYTKRGDRWVRKG